MTDHILVTGGTGRIGGRVVPLLVEAGATVRVLTRHGGMDAAGVTHVIGDVRKGIGLDAAVEGVGTVLHLAGGPKGDDVSTRNMAAAARGAGVRHLVLISVIGADRMPIGYFRAKASAERAVVESGVPGTILRVAQLHDFVLTALEAMARLPLVPAPRGLRFEPVEVGEVASRLAELTLAAPAGRVTDLAGPQVRPMDDLLRVYLAAKGRRRQIVPVHIPGRAGVGYRSGANLSERPDRRGRTWEEFLEEREAAASSAVG